MLKGHLYVIPFGEVFYYKEDLVEHYKDYDKFANPQTVMQSNPVIMTYLGEEICLSPKHTGNDHKYHCFIYNGRTVAIPVRNLKKLEWLPT